MATAVEGKLSRTPPDELSSGVKRQCPCENSERCLPHLISSDRGYRTSSFRRAAWLRRCQRYSSANASLVVCFLVCVAATGGWHDRIRTGGGFLFSSRFRHIRLRRGPAQA